MHPVVAGKLDELARLCAARHVKRLAVFGSAAAGEFNPAESDVDFVVEFLPVPLSEYARTYFGLLRALESLLGRPVDLVEAQAIRNPYFRAAVEESQVLLYDAA